MGIDGFRGSRSRRRSLRGRSTRERRRGGGRQFHRRWQRVGQLHRPLPRNHVVRVRRGNGRHRVGLRRPARRHARSGRQLHDPWGSARQPRRTLDRQRLGAARRGAEQRGLRAHLASERRPGGRRFLLADGRWRERQLHREVGRDILEAVGFRDEHVRPGDRRASERRHRRGRLLHHGRRRCREARHLDRRCRGLSLRAGAPRSQADCAIGLHARRSGRPRTVHQLADRNFTIPFAHLHPAWRPILF